MTLYKTLQCKETECNHRCRFLKCYSNDYVTCEYFRDYENKIDEEILQAQKELEKIFKNEDS